MKKLVNLKDAQVLDKQYQKSVIGGGPILNQCYPGTDPICCGSNQGQCGYGPYSGGYFAGYQNGYLLCDCV